MTLDCAGWPLIVNAQPCIIELPQAYHFGFNLGLNCAESTNFALPLWLPFGRAATRCCCAIGGDDVCVIDMRRFELVQLVGTVLEKGFEGAGHFWVPASVLGQSRAKSKESWRWCRIDRRYTVAWVCADTSITEYSNR